ncbi:thioesterase [Brachybacterium endophyticum]|uniref:Thioesterase n=1 Tax=Brachybacterium endophyticum TaxID=2182385 RepID=A0A2U2RIY8_9MICO|nr:PaaI family thioesterase [Brachybacterium endophyticum]PWH05826.1 thioesterase [Brachybacterium endophyticum]
MTGLEQLRWVMEHEGDDVPSIRRLLGIRVTEVEHGRVAMTVTTQPDFANPQGTVHGGVTATLLDSVMGCAVHSTLPADTSYTTLELKVNYVRGVALDGRQLTGEGHTVHVGRRTAVAEGRVLDEHGKLVGHATTTCLILA